MNKVSGGDAIPAELYSNPWNSPGQNTGVGQPILFPADLPTKEDPMDVGNLISSSSVFSKPSLHIWKFSVHAQLKPSKKELDHYLASM